MFVDFNILNQLGSPSINSNTFANRPAAGQTGRLFVSTDTFEIYRDNGTTWDLIGGTGSSTITGTGTATQVAYFTGAQTIGSSANLFWDNTNTRLGVGTATPGYTIEANGSAKVDALYLRNATAGNGVLYHEATFNRVTLANYNPNGILVFETNGGTIQMNIDPNGGVVIGNGISFANTSSILDITSTTKGFLQPRMTTTERNLITGPATGLTVYNTTSNTIDYYNGTSWISLSTTTGTVTGTGTATQVAFWNAASNITGSNNLYWDNTAGALGINTATPGAELDVHGTGTIVQVNATAATSNAYLAFQRTGTGIWRIGDTYNGGSNFFELHNTVLTIDALEFEAATNKGAFLAQQTYASGLATGNQFTYNLTVPNGVNITSPNAVGAVNSYLNLSLGGNTTVPAGARQGLEGNSRISFTGAGTLTMTQAATVRAFSALSSVYSFNGSAIGTITHLAGLRICFPDNIGSAINITNNYGLLLNNQTAGLGTVTYTNRWGIYQEGVSDLNYFAANVLIGSTTNSGEALQVTGTAIITSTLTAASFIPSGSSVPTNGLYLPAANTIGLSTNTTERFRINSTGVLFAGNGETSATPSVGIFSGTGATGTNIAGAELRIRGGASTGNANGGIVSFYTSTAGSSGSGVNAATEKGRFTAAGALGVGTTTPYHRITTIGSIGVQTTDFVAGSVGTQISLTLSNSTGNTQGELNAGNTGDTLPANLVLARYNANVGINTTTIGSRLQINGNLAVGYSASTAAPTNGLQVAGATNLNGTVTIADTINLVFSTGTGTRIGTATSQKLSFWNATPIVQPTTAVGSAARVGGGGATVTDTDTFGGYTIAQVVQALRNTGILA